MWLCYMVVNKEELLSPYAADFSFFLLLGNMELAADVQQLRAK